MLDDILGVLAVVSAAGLVAGPAYVLSLVMTAYRPFSTR